MAKAQTNPTNRPRLLTTREVADYLHLSMRSVRDLIKQGMPAIRVNRRVYRFDLDRVLAWYDERA